ncbi:MAG: PucR family transcriptional regulator [Halanaerobiales bacterium]|nr:PucR family transcriptional regulator [Halanaerobiales bacterium]
MTITLKEVLRLEKLKDFKVIAGRTGDCNKIKKVGILDYETKEMIEENFVEGEFVISTLLIIKDKVEELYEIVEKLILVGVSGLAIKNIYFDKLPDDVIELANSKSFPIMIFSEVYFEDVITSILDAISEKEESKILELKIDNILYSNINNVIIKKIAYEINRDFREKHIVVFCKRKDGDETITTGFSIKKENDKLFDKFCKIIPYKDGYLIIDTYENIDLNEVTKNILRRLEMLGFSPKHYIMGISGFHEKLEELNFSIKESMYAFKYSMTYKKDISFFDKIGTNKILLPLIDNPWIQKYYDEMITPLLIYDRKNDTELLKTAMIYIENNGDIKATAEELFQHSNTTRYRIDKIYKILSKDYDIEHFYEELAIAIRIHNLMDISL